MSNLIKLWKKYADGEVRSLDVKNTEANVKVMILNGFFLTEKEASTGKVEAEPEKPVAKKPAEKKPVKIVKKKG